MANNNKKKKNKRKVGRKKRKFYEFFRIKKKGKEKTIKVSGAEDIKKGTKKQIEYQNKLLRNLFIGIGILIIIILSLFWYFNSLSHFEYEGVKFDVIKEGNVIFYHTSFPMIQDGKDITYNVYLRNDPRKLKNVPFKGGVSLLEMMVIDNTENFVCGGDGGIAMYNFQQIFRAFGTNIIKDPNATCDSFGRYLFLVIKPGNQTSIEQFSPACYNLNVNNCEILDVTEKFIVETLVEINRLISSN